jgi:hypothetical protein
MAVDSLADYAAVRRKPVRWVLTLVSPTKRLVTTAHGTVRSARFVTANTQRIQSYFSSRGERCTCYHQAASLTAEPPCASCTGYMSRDQDAFRCQSHACPLCIRAKYEANLQLPESDPWTGSSGKPREAPLIHCQPAQFPGREYTHEKPRTKTHFIADSVAKGRSHTFKGH